MQEPDDAGAVVHHRGLAGGDALGRVEQLDDDLVAAGRHRDHGAVLVAVGAQLDGAVQRRGGDAAAPARPDALDVVDGELLAGADGHRAGDRLDVQDVARTAVVGGPADPQALALPDGEPERAVVACRAPRRSRGRRAPPTSARRSELLAQPAGGVAVGDEADVVAVRLPGDLQAAALRLGPDLGLRRVAEREQRVRELLLGRAPRARRTGPCPGRRRGASRSARPRRCRAGRSGRSRRRRSRAPAPGRARRRT